MKKLLLILLLGIVLLGTGCKKDDPIPVQSISFANSPKTVGLGQPIKISIKTFPENANIPYTLEWDVDKSLADFDETTQTLTRKANGPVTITAYIKDRHEVKASITIQPITATSVTFASKSIDAEVGKPQKLELVTTPVGSDKPEIVCSLSNPEFADFDASAMTLTLKEDQLVEVSIALKSNPTKKIDYCIVGKDFDLNIPDKNLMNNILVFYDKNNDKKLQRSEVAFLKNIRSLIYQDIKDLSGIEYFTNLEKLEICCTNNFDAKKNPKLSELYIENPIIDQYIDLSNSNIKKIKTFDINHKIKTINMNNCRNLSKIDISYSYNIKDLSIDNSTNIDTLMIESHLNTINTDHLTELIYFKSKGNSLQTLNISNNKKLKYFELCDSDIENIDFQHNTELKHIYIYFLSNLKSINLSNNLELTHLDCISTSIRNIDISKISKLNTISIDYCSYLSSIDISKNKVLTEASFFYNANLKNIYVWKGFIPTEKFKKDNKTSWIEVP